MDKQDDFGGVWGFRSAPSPSSSQPHLLFHAHRHQINGHALPVAGDYNDDDDEWGDFVAPPQSTPISFQSNLSNGFRHLQPSVITLEKSKDVDSFGFFQNNSTAQVLPSSTPFLDSGPKKFEKPQGPLPLSIFGEEEEEERGSDSVGNLDIADISNELIGRNPVESLRDGGLGVGGISGKLSNLDQRIKPANGLGSDSRSDPGLGGRDGGIDDADGWEFKGALFVSDHGDQAAAQLPGSEMEVITSRKKQDTSLVVEYKPGFSGFSYEFGDFFAASDGGFNKSSVRGHGLNFGPRTIISNGNVSVPFYGAEDTGKWNGIISSSMDNDGDLQDFGAFIVAPSVTGTRNQELRIVSPTDNANAHLFNGKEEQKITPRDTSELNLLSGEVQKVPPKPENANGTLPLSLFSFRTVDYDDNHQDAVVHNLSSDPKIGVSNQGAAGISIHDLISTLYSEALPNGQVLHSSSAIPGTIPTESVVQSSQMLESSRANSDYYSDDDDDDDDDDDSWEFKDAFSDTTVKQQQQQPLSPKQALDRQLSTESSNIQACVVDLYTKLRDELCVLVFYHLDDLKKAQNIDVVIGKDGKAGDVDREIQEAYEMLQDGVLAEGVHVNGQLPRKRHVNEILELLHAPEFQVLESEYLLSRKLQLAEEDWRSAIELLKHVRSGLKVLTLVSEKEQSAYLSTWARIITVCVQELRLGASIWKQALEKNVLCQVLSDLRGQRYIQALGELYRVVELVRISAKLYKPWILLLKSGNPITVFPLLDECATLWSHSGLEDSLRDVPDMVDSQRSVPPPVRELLESIKYIRDIDVLSLHDMDFTKRGSICELTLLPQGISSSNSCFPPSLCTCINVGIALYIKPCYVCCVSCLLQKPGLRTVLWDERLCFLNVANLWVNLISVDPPELPRLFG
ncbi:hypothetical protein Dimus_021717 [Dionaea muscipula]